MKFVIILLVLFTLSCTKENIPVESPDKIEKYIHISHTKIGDNSSIHQKALDIDYSSFRLTMLGGDIAHLSSHDDKTLNLIDNIFDLKNKNTLWSLGNHDYSNPQLIQSYTKRNTYYTHHINGITFIILDTQKDSCNIINEQLQLVENVIDTISNSSHLIILAHKLIWMPNHHILKDQIPTTSNGQLDEFHYSLFDNNFYEDIYPKLITLEKNQIEVICIGGDIGTNTNEMQFVTSDNIHYLASGLEYRKSNNQYLVFEHNLTKKALSWNYVK